MHPHVALITTFYEAFQRRDGAAMAACYHPEVEFSDPVFPDLKGGRAGAMWKMLCSQATELDIQFDGVEADHTGGKAHWVATYPFSKTGRRVVNDISASFTFADGKIRTHQDRFDLWKWTSMALGPTGTFLGWTPMVQGKVRATAEKSLAAWIAKNGV